MNAKRLLLIILIGLLLTAPVSAKMVTAKVDDKGVTGYGHASFAVVGTLHTKYGEITVSNEDYNRVEINDTIRYDTDIPFWFSYWDVEVI